MSANDDPEERIRELERPLADAARASELESTQSPGVGYPPGPTGAPAPPPQSYGGPFPGPPPQRRSGNRMRFVLITVVAIGTMGVAAVVAVLAGHQPSGTRSVVRSPPAGSPSGRGPSTPRAGTPTPISPAPPPGGAFIVSGLGEKRAHTCNDSIVDVAGTSNTVVITGHCATISVSGVQNTITVDAVDSIDASGLNNKVIYRSGTPKISNSGVSNVVQQG